jgi:hypothetical protein
MDLRGRQGPMRRKSEGGQSLYRGMNQLLTAIPSPLSYSQGTLQVNTRARTLPDAENDLAEKASKSACDGLNL